MSANKHRQPRLGGTGHREPAGGRRIAGAVRVFGDLITFGAEPGPYPVPPRGESVAKGWANTGNALRRALSTAREKA